VETRAVFEQGSQPRSLGHHRLSHASLASSLPGFHVIKTGQARVSSCCEWLTMAHGVSPSRETPPPRPPGQTPRQNGAKNMQLQLSASQERTFPGRLVGWPERTKVRTGKAWRYRCCRAFNIRLEPASDVDIPCPTFPHSSVRYLPCSRPRFHLILPYCSLPSNQSSSSIRRARLVNSIGNPISKGIYHQACSLCCPGTGSHRGFPCLNLSLFCFH
jgi:hypothetical protein